MYVCTLVVITSPEKCFVMSRIELVVPNQWAVTRFNPVLVILIVTFGLSVPHATDYTTLALDLLEFI